MEATFAYGVVSCADYLKGNCDKGDACPEAHGISEHLYHPARFRKLPCKALLFYNRACRFGPMCAFYHSFRDYRG